MSSTAQRSLIKQIKDVHREIDNRKAQRDDLFEALAKLSPLKIGDSIKATGWSHQGKPFQITKVTVRFNAGSFEYGYHGLVLKKDGSVGTYRASAYTPILSKAK
jgi:hypothetical protein